MSPYDARPRRFLEQRTETTLGKLHAAGGHSVLAKSQALFSRRENIILNSLPSSPASKNLLHAADNFGENDIDFIRGIVERSTLPEARNVRIRAAGGRSRGRL